MAKQTISIGSSANDGTGTTIRAGGDLINDNFNEIYPNRHTFRIILATWQSADFW